MDGSGAHIEAVSPTPRISLRIEYPSDNTAPTVYLNGSDKPSEDCAPVLEGVYGNSVFEEYPSSVIIPTWFRRDQVLIHMRLHDDLLKNPMDAENTSDHQYHLLKDPLNGAMIQWAP